MQHCQQHIDNKGNLIEEPHLKVSYWRITDEVSAALSSARPAQLLTLSIYFNWNKISFLEVFYFYPRRSKLITQILHIELFAQIKKNRETIIQYIVLAFMTSKLDSQTDGIWIPLLG